MRRARFTIWRYAQIAGTESAKQSDDRGLRERFQKTAIEHRGFRYRRYFRILTHVNLEYNNLEDDHLEYYLMLII